MNTGSKYVISNGMGSKLPMWGMVLLSRKDLLGMVLYIIPLIVLTLKYLDDKAWGTLYRIKCVFYVFIFYTS